MVLLLLEKDFSWQLLYVTCYKSPPPKGLKNGQRWQSVTIILVPPKNSLKIDYIGMQ
jgi:hypothetical protein